jgi:hypothetical protein
LVFHKVDSDIQLKFVSKMANLAIFGQFYRLEFNFPRFLSVGKLNGLNLVLHKVDSDIQLKLVSKSHLGQSYRLEFKLSQVFELSKLYRCQ